MTLQIDNVVAGYQEGINILTGMSLAVAPESVAIIIGPNGAGKSTLLKTIYGFLKPHQGNITFDGRDTTVLQPHEIKRLGISYIPQEFNIFPQLSVEQNLNIGAWIFRHDAARVREQLDYTYGIFPVLGDLRKKRANYLSGGQLRMLSIAKEVMTRPKLMLVDEPTAGLSPKVATEAYEFLIRTQRTLKAAMLLVDHNMEEAIELSDHVHVIDMGRVRAHGPRSEFDAARIRQIIQECLLGV